MGICDPVYSSYVQNNIIVVTEHKLDIDTSKQIRTETLDITDINKIVYPTVIMARWYGGLYVGDVKVYEIWLDK